MPAGSISDCERRCALLIAGGPAHRQGTFPSGRFANGIVAEGSSVYLFGTWGALGGTLLDEQWELDTTTMIFRDLSCRAEGSCSHLLTTSSVNGPPEDRH